MIYVSNMLLWIKSENKRPDTDTARYEMATVRHNSFFKGLFVQQHKAAYERDYLAIGACVEII